MKYGFHTEVYEDGTEQKCVGFGDGKAVFSTIHYKDEHKAGVSIEYGKGEGIGSKLPHLDGVPQQELAPDLILQFDNPNSVQVLIDKLELIKEELSV